MRITIVGAGRVGVYLAKYFASENQDVFLVDSDSEQLAVLESDFNMRTFVGDPVDIGVLREAGAGASDVFVAVTASTAENLVACAMAKSLGARRTIARVEQSGFTETDNVRVLSRMGVDNVVYPDFLAAQTILKTLEHSWARSIDYFFDGAIVMVAVSVTAKAPIAGKFLRDLFSEGRYFHVSALRRNHQTIVPTGADRIESGDILYLTSTPQGIAKIVELTGRNVSANIRKVVLMGASDVARILMNTASERFVFTVIEKNIERCREIAAQCDGATVIYGDAGEYDVLEEAGIGKSDAFVALSDNSESNILSCLTAKEYGVMRTIAEVEKEQLLDKAESFNIGGVVNKPILTANAMLQMILASDTRSPRSFIVPGAEVVDLEIRVESGLTGRPVMELNLPKGITFAGMMRGGESSIVSGTTRFAPGDRVIVFCRQGVLDKVYKLFKEN